MQRFSFVVHVSRDDLVRFNVGHDVTCQGWLDLFGSVQKKSGCLGCL